MNNQHSQTNTATAVVYLLLAVSALLLLPADIALAEAKLPGVGEGVPRMDAMLPKVLKGLIYVVGCFLLCASLYKKYGPNKASQPQETIEIVSRKVVGPKASLVIVDIDGERLLLSHTSEQLSLIKELEKRTEEAGETEQNQNSLTTESNDISLQVVR